MAAESRSPRSAVMMMLNPERAAMNDQIVTMPCSWLNCANAPTLNPALIPVMVDIANDAPAEGIKPNRMALTTIRMIENNTISGRPTGPGASMIDAQQTISPSSHKPPSAKCALKRSKLLRRYATKIGPMSKAPDVALAHQRTQWLGSVAKAFCPER